MSAYRHILLGLDLSVESHQVVDRAAALRDAFGSELSVIHVIEPLSFAYGGDIPMDFSGIQEEIHKQARAHMTQLCDPLNIPEKNRHLVVGRPETEIHHVAEEIGADLVVVGSHGRHGLSLLMGSTANGVLHGLGQPWQVLDAERAVRDPVLARGDERRGQRADGVARERRPELLRPAQHRFGQLLVHRVGVRLVGEDGDRPPFLGGDDGLVVPVGALDQADVDVSSSPRRPTEQAIEVALGVAQVRLDDGARVLVVAELLLVEQRREHLVGQVAVTRLLEVEREGRPVGHRLSLIHISEPTRPY